MKFLDNMFKPLTPEEQAHKDRMKAQQRRDRAAAAARRAEIERERLENLPHFRVREVREVLVQAEDMKDAIALASAAFKEGQDSDHGIKWGKPFGVSGDTKGPITTVDIRAIEEEMWRLP